jgi:hypothetical protein
MIWITALLACAPDAVIEPPGPPPAADRAEPSPQEPASWSVASCNTSPLRDALQEKTSTGRGGRTLHLVDVDGDGTDDELRLQSSSGSGFASDAIELTLSTGPRLSLEHTFSFSSILHEVPYPEGSTEVTRQLLADALWGTTCPTPDPSLQALLSGEVVWHPGPAVVPPFYVTPTHAGWALYAGHTQGGMGEYRGKFPRELGSRGGVTLVAMAHGLVAQTAAAHAWLYVHGGGAKLRVPADLAAEFIDDDTVKITETPSILVSDGPAKVFQRSVSGRP